MDIGGRDTVVMELDVNLDMPRKNVKIDLSYRLLKVVSMYALISNPGYSRYSRDHDIFIFLFFFYYFPNTF